MAASLAALQAYLANQGKAGAQAPSYATLGNLGSISVFTAPQLNLGAQTTPLDFSGLTSYYADPSNSDYLSDPVLLQQIAQDNTTRSNADSAALKAREQLLAQLGDRSLAETVLGPNDPTLGAVSDDPNNSTSILARLLQGYDRTTATNEDQLNKGNLWYSSERGRVLNQGAQDLTDQRADAITNAQQGLEGISSQLAAAKNGAYSSDEQAQAEAYNRYITALEANPPSALPGGGSGATEGPAGAGEPSGSGASYPNSSYASGAGQVLSGAAPTNYQAKKNTLGEYLSGPSGPAPTTPNPTSSSSFSTMQMTPSEVSARNKRNAL